MLKPESSPEAEPERKEVWKMFDRIAHRYDLLNRLLSLGQDVVWRKRMAKHVPNREDLRLLDLATGTADQIIFLLGKAPQISSATGMDMSEGMLAEGKEKIQKLGLAEKVILGVGDATNVPAEDASCDLVTISFGIRNVMDVAAALREMHRVLDRDGRALILEFSLPRNRLLRGLYLFYFRHILPLVGGLVSGDHYAYNYLNKTVETFPYGEEFCDLLKDAGFRNVGASPLTFGIATIYRGDK